MSQTPYLGINIDNQPVELTDRDNLGLSVSYILEDADQFQQKSGSPAFNINIPATPANDRIFNTYHNPNVEDMSGTDAYTNPRKCEIIVGGITILKGKSLLQDASHTRIAAGYNINAYGQNGDWVIDMKDVSLWDCLNTATHTFDVLTVEATWGAFNIDEYNDYVYAPVRYRQPFGDDDDTVNIYHLRPAISIYWLLIRGWRQFGYTVRSQFLESSYFQGMVMPWTWGDFFDINSQLQQIMAFKATGRLPIPPPVGSTPGVQYLGPTNLPGFSGWAINPPGGSDYVKTIGTTDFFQMDNVNLPNGYDNSNLYSFDEATGKMIYNFTPPASIASHIGPNTALNFTLTLYVAVRGVAGGQVDLQLEASVNGAIVSSNTIFPDGGPIVGATNYPALGTIYVPTVYGFTMPNIHQGDVLSFRLKWIQSGTTGALLTIIQAQYLDLKPTGTAAWQFDPATGKMVNIANNATINNNKVWTQAFSSLEMTGIQLAVGGTVDFKLYDKFRDYRFMDLLGGLIDMFNLSVQTDPINKVITIEATHEWKLPTGGAMPGYFKPERIDWTDKQDLVQPNTMNLFSDCERQFDFSFKVDSSDGMQNIYAARYRGIYLANKIANSFNRLNNTNNDNGIKAGVPGASRYMFPERFRKGSRQLTNRFFSATMHYDHTSWKFITGVSPQLIAIIPENINDSSASAVSAIFEPKIAFYKGYMDNTLYGGWRYIGDPNAHGIGSPTYTDATGALGFDLPFMFSVNYKYRGGLDPVLSYCRQLLDTGAGIAPVAGLMETFFFKRLAMMRHGRQYKPWVRLNSGDMTDWFHRNTIILNGALYYLIGVDRWNPLSDNPAQCTLWKVAHIEQVEFDNSYPSDASVNGATVLSQFDIRYAPLLIFVTDLPQ